MEGILVCIAAAGEVYKYCLQPEYFDARNDKCGSYLDDFDVDSNLGEEECPLEELLSALLSYSGTGNSIDDHICDWSGWQAACQNFFNF